MLLPEPLIFARMMGGESEGFFFFFFLQKYMKLLRARGKGFWWRDDFCDNYFKRSLFAI